MYWESSGFGLFFLLGGGGAGFVLGGRDYIYIYIYTCISTHTYIHKRIGQRIFKACSEKKERDG